MLSNKVSRTLFRSLLRWNRRPEVVASKFSIDTAGFGIDKVLPKDYKVIGHEGVQSAIFHCFRRNEATDENIDLCFSVLKSLNELSVELKERLDFRLANLDDERNKKATFKIGQIVRYKKLKYRGIVSGWTIDPETGNQKIEVVFDMMDVNENYDGRYRIDSDYIKSEHFTVIEDKALTRVFNPSLASYFLGYNEAINRYIPKDELLFLYPRDFEAYDVVKGDGSVVSSESSPLSADLKESSDRVYEAVRSIGGKLESIIRQYVSKEEYEQMFSEMRDIELVKRDNLSQKSTNHLTVMRQVLDEVLTMVKMCGLSKNSTVIDKSTENGIRTIQFFETVGGRDAFGGDINDSEVRVQNNVMYQRLRRGGAFLKEQQKNNRHSSSVQSRENNTMYDGLNLSMDRSYEALSSLTKLNNIIDQLLQLRFQNKGLGHFESLRVVSDSEGNKNLVEFEDAGKADKDAVKSVRFLDLESSLPAAKFEIGQVVRHKQFNYRGIVSGYDQKPLIDVSKWEAVANTPLGAEQPFYKVVPDDRTSDGMRSIYYAAQDNLELITDADDMIISNKNIRHYFLGFDNSTNKYIPKHKLSYCFPDAKHQQAVLSGENTTSDQKKNGFVMNSSEYTYDIIDKILVECYVALRETFSTARKDYCTQKMPLLAKTSTTPDATNSMEPLAVPKSDSTGVLHVEDLLTHMRRATTRETALMVESVMWLVWMAHDDPDVNKAMRLGVSSGKRGQNDKSYDLYSIASALDRQYSEAHNKLAALHHARGEDEECLRSAKMAVALFPQHFGALSGMGLAYEKLGNFTAAKNALRQALNVHPWAANLPTLVMDVEKNLRPREKYVRTHYTHRSRGSSIGGDTSSETTPDANEAAASATADAGKDATAKTEDQVSDASATSTTEDTANTPTKSNKKKSRGSVDDAKDI